MVGSLLQYSFFLTEIRSRHVGGNYKLHIIGIIKKHCVKTTNNTILMEKTKDWAPDTFKGRRNDRQ